MSAFSTSYRNWPIKFFQNLSLLGLFFLCLVPSRIAKGCGPLLTFEGYSFIEPAIMNMQAAYAPFILRMDEIYDFYEGQEAITIDQNIDEWRTRYCNRAPAEAIQQLVYKTSVRNLDQLLTATLSPSMNMPNRLSANPFATYLYRNGCSETIEYLIYAKYCEPYVQALDQWTDEERDLVAMNDLILQGLETFKNVKSHYIRLRYAFQIIRLAHYSNQYNRVLELYDELMPMIDHDPSIIEDWIIAHRAGALKSLEQYVEAAYLFSLIFDRCPSRRTQAFRSFELQSEEEWRACMKLCQTDHERANLHVLRANNSHSNILEEMEQIYALDPQNENLPLLLIREMRNLEKDLLGLEFNDKKFWNKRYFQRPRTEAGDLVLGLDDFVKQVLKEQAVRALDLWKIADGYLQFLAGNYYYAKRTFERIEPTINNELLKEQLQTFQTALQISAFNAVNDSIERTVDAITRTTTYESHPDFEDFLGDKMAKLYQQKGYPGKAFMMQHDLYDLRPNPKMSIIDDLLSLAEKPRKNRLERELLRNRRDTSNIVYVLLDMKATNFLNNGLVEAALETYKQIPEGQWDDFGVFNPFHESIKDCVFNRCRIPDTLILMNKGEIMNVLIGMEYQAKADPENAAELFYKLGNAYYNMTYFSYAWNVMDYFRSGSSLPLYPGEKGEDVQPSYGTPFGNRENFDCSRAADYYERARILAKDPELAAKAAFMAAKCERNRFYAYGGERTYNNFYLLATTYRNTEFYQDAINECKYFEAYLNR